MAKETDVVETPNKQAGLPEVEQELSQVATNPKQSLLILVGISAVFLYLVYYLFIGTGGNSGKEQDKTPVPQEVAKPVQASADDNIPAIPTLPSPPKLEDPTPPAPPPPSEAEPLPQPPAALPDSSVPPAALAAPALPLGQADDEELRKRMEAKRKSSIILVSGTPPQKTPEQIQEETDFKYRGDMNLLLGRGKMIDAVIETAINTDFGGEIRALVNRDVYSEWGKNILIPKGSRVFGNYATGIDGAYGRISITWSRVDLANGYTLNLAGTGIDALGRKGNQGRVDNKFKERFSNAVLRSAFKIALANTVDSIVKPQISSQAAANQTQAASAIKTLATQIITQAPNPLITADQDAGIKLSLLCAQVPAAITDKTSTTFTQITAACASIQANPAGTNATKLQSVMNTINSSGDALLQNTTANVETTKAQDAAKEAVTDISDTVKEMIEQQQFKPTITIDQGTPVKIYVNRDYKFPQAAVSTTRRVQ